MKIHAVNSNITSIVSDYAPHSDRLIQLAVP